MGVGLHTSNQHSQSKETRIGRDAPGSFRRNLHNFRNLFLRHCGISKQLLEDNGYREREICIIPLRLRFPRLQAHTSANNSSPSYSGWYIASSTFNNTIRITTRL